MKLLYTISDRLARFESFTLVALLFFMLGLAFLQVVLRNVFHSGFVWADILNRYIVLWVGFLGASLATYHHRHIAIDALYRFLPESMKAYARIVTNFLSLIVTLLLLYAAWSVVTDLRVFGEQIESLGISTWYMILIVPIAFCLIAFRFFLIIAQAVTETLKRSQ